MSSSRFRLSIHRILGLVSAVALSTACGGSDGNDGLSPGGSSASSFTATLVGGSPGVFSGSSSAAIGSGLFGIGLTTADGKFLLSFARAGTRPAAGAYSLGDNPLTGFSASLDVGPPQVIYTSMSGTLTITESTVNSIKGTFSFNAAVSVGSGPPTTVSGSFAAVCASGC
jgi:hypothetical protein